MKAGPRASGPVGGSASTWALIVLLIAGGLIYLMFPSRIYECDSVIYATRAIHADISEAVDAAHLGFDLIEYGTARMGRRLSPPASPICILAYVSVAAGLSGILVFWYLLRRLGASTATGVLLSGSLMFSYTYWHYSLQAESHILAGLLIMLLALQVHRLLGRPTLGNALAASLLLALATLIHQTSALLLPAILAGVMMASGSRTSKYKVLLALIISPVILIGVPTLFVGILVARGSSAGDLHPWLASSQLRHWGHWRAMSLPSAAVGLARSFAGSHYLLGFDQFRRFALRLFPSSSLQDELRVAGLVPAQIRLALVPVQTVLMVFFGWAGLGALRRLRSASVMGNPYTGFLVAWVLTLTVFVIWWAPERSEFWIVILIPGMLLLGIPGLSRPVSGIRLPAAGILVAALFAVNFLGSIYPQSARVAERETCVAVGIDAVVETGDIVLSDCGFSGRASRYVPSFQKVNLLAPGGRAEAGGGLEHMIPCAMCAVDSLLTIAARDRRTVYIIMTPLSEEPEPGRLYAGILNEVQERFVMSGIIPVRAPVELRRIESRKP